MYINGCVLVVNNGVISASVPFTRKLNIYPKEFIFIYLSISISISLFFFFCKFKDGTVRENHVSIVLRFGNTNVHCLHLRSGEWVYF